MAERPEEPCFPAIAVGRGDSFSVVRSLDELATATCGGLGTFYRELYVFDSKGLLWPVQAEPQAGVPGVLDRLLNRRITLQLRLGKPRTSQLSVVAEWLCDLVDADRDDVYGQFVTHDELKRRFRASVTAKELIEHAGSLGES